MVRWPPASDHVLKLIKGKHWLLGQQKNYHKRSTCDGHEDAKLYAGIEDAAELAAERLPAW
jgi:hypothetical protein